MKSGRQSGFTYVTALLLVAACAAALAATAQVWSTTRQREKEAELIWIGNQFVQAIGLYYQRSPGAIKRYPDKLEDLLEDKRYLSAQRYLRRTYRDPMTGKMDWGLVRAPDGGVMGIYSLSEQHAIKTDRLAVSINLVSSAQYSEWRFVYPPSAIGTREASP